MGGTITNLVRVKHLKSPGLDPFGSSITDSTVGKVQPFAIINSTLLRKVQHHVPMPIAHINQSGILDVVVPILQNFTIFYHQTKNTEYTCIMYIFE